MKTITWEKFRSGPMKYLTAAKVIKAVRGDGSFFIIRHYSPYDEDFAYKKPFSKFDKSRKKKHRCHFCRKTYRVKFVLPYDASYSPGYYCPKCMKERDILDISKAKEYGKIF